MTTARADASGWTAETQAGLVDSHLSADWSTSLLGLRVKIGASAGTTDGITGFVDAEGKATQHVRTGMTLQLDLSGGVTMTLRWATTVLTPEKHTKSTRFSRLGQRITLPVMLTHDLNPYVLFGVTVVPAVGYLAAHRYIIQPRKRRQIAESVTRVVSQMNADSSRVKDLRKNHADYISEKRKEALEAVSVMQAATAKKAAAEREKNGLVIIEAYYGCAECFTDRGMKERDSDSDDQHESYIDVTIPIQALVNDSTLVIPGGRGKYHLLGLYDPCIGENKKLRVRYSFRGRVHQVTVDDTVGLRAPLKGVSVAIIPTYWLLTGQRISATRDTLRLCVASHCEPFAWLIAYRLGNARASISYSGKKRASSTCHCSISHNCMHGLSRVIMSLRLSIT
jgi:DnaJ family protein C protein 11